MFIPKSQNIMGKKKKNSCCNSIVVSTNDARYIYDMINGIYILQLRFKCPSLEQRKEVVRMAKMKSLVMPCGLPFEF
jgi:ribosomal protein S2